MREPHRILARLKPALLLRFDVVDGLSEEGVRTPLCGEPHVCSPDTLLLRARRRSCCETCCETSRMPISRPSATALPFDVAHVHRRMGRAHSATCSRVAALYKASTRSHVPMCPSVRMTHHRTRPCQHNRQPQQPCVQQLRESSRLTMYSNPQVPPTGPLHPVAM